MTHVSLISTLINLLTNTAITIDVIESCSTGTCERTIGVSAISFWKAIMCKNIITDTFINVLADIVTICEFLVAHITNAIIATVVVFASEEVWACCGSMVTLVNIETTATIVSKTDTSAIVSARTSAFKGCVNIGTSNKLFECVFFKYKLIF